MKKIVALIVITFISLPCYAQELKFSTISEQLNNLLDQLTKRSTKGEFNGIIPREKDRDYLSYAVSQANRASNIILAGPVKYSQPFLISLEYDMSAFSKFLNTADILLKENTGARMPLSIINSVYDAAWNLELKARVLKESNKDQIEVTAHTSDGKGKDVHGCIVWYVNVLADEEKDKLRFDRFSTPTTHSMPGGKYHIWTEKNGKYGRKDPFSCGDDGKSKREIDLLAPEN